MEERIKIGNIWKNPDSLLGNNVVVKGWIRTIRDQKKFAFIEVNDGSSLNGLQVIADDCLSNFEKLSKLTTGSSISVFGEIIKSPGKNQAVELKAAEVEIVGDCPGDSYPLQKKRHSQEFLRTIAHLRGRTNTISAVSRVRSAAAFASHQFFQNEGFLFVQTPLITPSDCEGAGEMFRVTTLPIDDVSSMPTMKNSTLTDFGKDFFEKPAFLTVSGQLSAETYACALGDVYTFGPTFRAENSHSTRHLAEFHMIEPEMSFADLNDAMDNAEGFVKYVASQVRSQCENDIKFFEKFIDPSIRCRLDCLIDKPFGRICYRDAIKELQNVIAKDPSKWSFPNVEFGTDLHSEHEKWLAEVLFQGSVFVHNYPRQIKSFYMRDSDKDPETVDSFDLLVPGIGELIGGSQREERYERLKTKIAESQLSEADYWWYLELRKFGTVPHSGYGVGFERLICYLTGIENIREAIAYPRFPGSLEF